ncbi:MAG: hypothetical protein KGJ81_12320, partial [Alphaproteobacteria bacterium]|nr:hypothetical protein [Alphaproteobacteria bacterium]
MRHILLAAFAVALIACSPVKNTVIPTDPKKWDTELFPKIKDLPDNDKQLLKAYLARAVIRSTLGNGLAVPPDTTVADAIQDEQKFEAQQKAAEKEAEALKARALAVRAEALKKLNNAVTLVVASKIFVPKDVMAERFSDHVDFIFVVKNKTNKDIAGVKGTVEFDDMFGSLVE